MSKSVDKVEEFHKTFNAPMLDKPTIPKDRAMLRYNLLYEELSELLDAIKNNDIVEAADAIIDLQYVLDGAKLEFGLNLKFDELFSEVHRSNMSKACDSEQEATNTVKFYEEKDGTLSHYKSINGKFVVYRNSDNKVLKSINYSPANLKNILEK